MFRFSGWGIDRVDKESQIEYTYALVILSLKYFPSIQIVVEKIELRQKCYLWHFSYALSQLGENEMKTTPFFLFTDIISHDDFIVWNTYYPFSLAIESILDGDVI